MEKAKSFAKLGETSLCPWLLSCARQDLQLSGLGSQALCYPTFHKGYVLCSRPRSEACTHSRIRPQHQHRLTRFHMTAEQSLLSPATISPWVQRYELRKAVRSLPWWRKTGQIGRNNSTILHRSISQGLGWKRSCTLRWSIDSFTITKSTKNAWTPTDSEHWECPQRHRIVWPLRCELFLASNLGKASEFGHFKKRPLFRTLKQGNGEDSSYTELLLMKQFDNSMHCTSGQRSMIIGLVYIILSLECRVTFEF